MKKVKKGYKIARKWLKVLPEEPKKKIRKNNTQEIDIKICLKKTSKN